MWLVNVRASNYIQLPFIEFSLCTGPVILSENWWNIVVHTEQIKKQPTNQTLRILKSNLVSSLPAMERQNSRKMCSATDTRWEKVITLKGETHTWVPKKDVALELPLCISRCFQAIVTLACSSHLDKTTERSTSSLSTYQQAVDVFRPQSVGPKGFMWQFVYRVQWLNVSARLQCPSPRKRKFWYFESVGAFLSNL